MAMLETPMLFDDYAHARRAMNGGKTFELITNGFTEKSGMRVLNAFPLGFRHFYTKKPVATIDDMKHLRMRVPNIPLYINFAKECGISGQPMPFAEVTGALDQGVIDGGDSPLSDIVSIKMYETTPEITLTGHLLVIHSLYINEKFYQSLPEQDKKWIDEAAKRSADYVWDLVEKVDADAVKTITEAGGHVSEPSPNCTSSCRTPASAAGSFSMTPSRMPRKSLTARTLIVRRSNVCVLNRASGAGRRPFFPSSPCLSHGPDHHAQGYIMSSENKPVMPPERIEETETEEEIRREEAAKGKGERAFEVFCAAIFLGMIGLVFFNAFLRYVFRSSFAPSEEWARFLFIYITFIGGIEAFYRHKHIAVDMFVNMISGASRKAVDIVASLFMLAALVLLLFGGISVVLQTLDTYSVATDVNMAFINGTLPVMAFAAIIIHLRDIVRLIRTPAGEFNTAPKTE